MPWKETCVMEERFRFILYYLEHEWPMSALCREFGISRRTGYKWVSRYLEDNEAGLHDRSRSPHHHPQAVSEEIECEVLSARYAHPTWGPKKLQVLLDRQDSSVNWPAASTIGEILKRHGLVLSRRRRRTTRRYSEPFVGCDYPNAVWSADLKGWFTTGDGCRCDPLTITDNYSRYLFRCQTVRATTHEAIKPVLEAAFREYEPITVFPLPPLPLAASQSYRSGGLSSVLFQNGLNLANQPRTVVMSECIGH